MATGDGDIMMRFAPSMLAVEYMRSGFSPSAACQQSLSRITKVYKDFQGALVAVDKNGNIGAACMNMNSFSFTFASQDSPNVTALTVQCNASESNTLSDVDKAIIAVGVIVGVALLFGVVFTVFYCKRRQGFEKI